MRKLEPQERRFCELVAADRAVYAGQPVYRVGRRAQKLRAWRELLARLVERGQIKVHRDAPGFDPLVSLLAASIAARDNGMPRADAIAAIRAKLDALPYYAPLAKHDFALLARYVDEIRTLLRKG